MRTPILFSVVALFALPTVAAAEIYSWKDASGKTIYSDKPPLEKKAKAREVATGSKVGSEPAAPKPADASAQDKPAEGTAAPAKTAEQQQAETEARQKLCDNARKRLIQLEATQGILITKDEKGQSTPLVGDARRAETESARKDVETWCK
jgi:hypothetical protein